MEIATESESGWWGQALSRPCLYSVWSFLHSPADGLYLHCRVKMLPVPGQGEISFRLLLLPGIVHVFQASFPKRHSSPLFVDQWRAKFEREIEGKRGKERERRCAGKRTRAKAKLHSEAEEGGWRQPLIMARPQFDVLWKVTVDESSIIYSITEQGYLFFQQHEQQKGSWHKTSSQSWCIHVTVRRRRGDFTDEGGGEADSPWLLLTPPLSPATISPFM